MSVHMAVVFSDTVVVLMADMTRVFASMWVSERWWRQLLERVHKAISLELAKEPTMAVATE